MERVTRTEDMMGLEERGEERDHSVFIEKSRGEEGNGASRRSGSWSGSLTGGVKVSGLNVEGVSAEESRRLRWRQSESL